MAQMEFDENQIKNLPLGERLGKIEEVLKNSKDESERWDSVWLAGEIAAQTGENSPMYNKVADLLSWALKHDDNTVVRHEICYQIAGRNMNHKIPDLREAGLHDESALVRHEAIECLSIIHAHDEETITAFNKSLKDPDKHVRDTAKFVLKRLKRTQRKFEPNTAAF